MWAALWCDRTVVYNTTVMSLGCPSSTQAVFIGEVIDCALFLATILHHFLPVLLTEDFTELTKGHFDCSDLVIKSVTNSHFASFFIDSPRLRWMTYRIPAHFPYLNWWKQIHPWLPARPGDRHEHKKKYTHTHTHSINLFLSHIHVKID